MISFIFLVQENQLSISWIRGKLIKELGKLFKREIILKFYIKCSQTAKYPACLDERHVYLQIEKITYVSRRVVNRGQTSGNAKYIGVCG